ncbi:MAG: response regulator [Candidatus Marinimicrobia bacterium]|nr:response regulator [Candidatus Neomarinimicrobiota bacterium]
MKKIAVVEDNPDNRLLICAILEDYYEINEYETGLEAIKGLKKEVPSLILLDISLPGMDGPEVLKLLKEEELTKDVPVIAITAYAMAGDREKYLKLGFDDYITKPIIDEDLILKSIKNLIND